MIELKVTYSCNQLELANWAQIIHKNKKFDWLSWRCRDKLTVGPKVEHLQKLQLKESENNINNVKDRRNTYWIDRAIWEQ